MNDAETGTTQFTARGRIAQQFDALSLLVPQLEGRPSIVSLYLQQQKNIAALLTVPHDNFEGAWGSFKKTTDDLADEIGYRARSIPYHSQPALHEETMQIGESFLSHPWKQLFDYMLLHRPEIVETLLQNPMQVDAPSPVTAAKRIIRTLRPDEQISDLPRGEQLVKLRESILPNLEGLFHPKPTENAYRMLRALLLQKTEQDGAAIRQCFR